MGGCNTKLNRLVHLGCKSQEVTYVFSNTKITITEITGLDIDNL